MASVGNWLARVAVIMVIALPLIVLAHATGDLLKPVANSHWVFGFVAGSISAGLVKWEPFASRRSA